MSAVIADYPLKIVGNNLQIGQMFVPISTARFSHIFHSTHEIQVCCPSMARHFEMNITLQLQSAEKVKECIRLLLAQTKTTLSAPKIYGMTPHARSVSFKFDNEDDAQVFIDCYAPCFFPDEAYEHILDGNRCQVLCRTEGKQVDRINQDLQNLDRRISGHVIQKCLKKVKDHRFPARYQPTAHFHPNLSLNEGHEHDFIISPEKILHTQWTKHCYGEIPAKLERPSSYEELDSLINNHHESVQMIRDFLETYRNAEKVTGNSAYSSYIPPLEKLLKDVESRVEEELKKNPLKPFLSDLAVDTIIKECLALPNDPMEVAQPRVSSSSTSSAI